MAMEDFNSAYQAITQLEAQDSIVGMKLAMVPHMDQKGRDKFSRALHKMAFPNEKPKAITIEEMARLVNG